jgi:hypothetical protein
MDEIVISKIIEESKVMISDHVSSVDLEKEDLEYSYQST